MVKAIINKIELIQVKCSGCGTAWIPRVPRPVECVSCHKRLEYEESEVEVNVSPA